MNLVMMIREFKSVVLTTRNLDRTAAFYRDVLQIPLEEERHRGTLRHWACQVGAMHFAIHDEVGFWLPDSPTTPSFTVESLEPITGALAKHEIAIAAQTKIGPMSFLAVRDPDGRHVCFGTPWPSYSKAEHATIAR
jgi:catechol 2,3-dioxygenase-like lactoylglutathione lyase family enzyme